MKIQVKINSIKYVNEINDYWSNQDFIELLEKFNFPDVEQIKDADLREMLLMAITDLEPAEAAQILLTHKLSTQLSEGQIQSISHEMLLDKVAEEYPEPDLHFDLFNVNQLLFEAYNGTFPNTEASIINVELHPEKDDDDQLEITEEVVTKALSEGLSDKSLIKRLYADQIEGQVPFVDAAKFIWLFNKKENNHYELLTSRYWIDKDDVVQNEYVSNIVFFKEEN